MEYELESSLDSELDDFIVSDDYDSQISWYSGDSTRPQGPSPPSSRSSSASTVVSVHTRQRRRRRAPVSYEEPSTQPQDSRSPSQATTIARSTSSASSVNVDEYSDRTQYSVESNSRPDDQYDPEHPEYSPFSPHSLASPQYYYPVPPFPRYEPQSPFYSPQYEPVSPQYSLASPQYEPTTPQYSPTSPFYSPSSTYSPSPPYYSPRTPDYSPTTSSESDMNSDGPHSPEYPPPVISDSSRSLSPSVRAEDEPETQVVQPPAPVEAVEEQNHVEAAVENPQVQQDIGPPLDRPQSPQVAQYVDIPTEAVVSTPTAPVTAAELNSSVLSDTDDGSLCAICMDPLTNSGSHRVVCLKCGHIFGHKCVERWIKVGCTNGVKRCPTCNKKASLRDIRILYLPKVVPLDTIEKDLLIREKEEMALQKCFMEKEVAKLKFQSQLNAKKYEEKIVTLQNELKEAVNTIELLHQGKKITPILNNDMKKEGINAELLHSLEISKIGNCRVLAFCPLLQQMVISQPTGNTLFAGYGVRLLNTVDFQPGRFIYLHTKVIRDLAFHAEDRGLLLSVSMDCTSKLLDVSNGSIVHHFKGDEPLWSCCWDVSNPHLLLVGSQMGKVYQYDRRMMDRYLEQWHNPNKTPVVALSSVPAMAGSPFPQGGFLSCRLNNLYAYVRNSNIHDCKELPMEGPFMSMRYIYDTQTLLALTRPSSRCPYAQVSFNQLEVFNHELRPTQIQTFHCGTTARVLSRFNVFPMHKDSLVVAHHESGRAINMWSTWTGKLLASIPTKDPIIDLSPVSLPNNQCLLAALSDKKVDIYKVT